MQFILQAGKLLEPQDDRVYIGGKPEEGSWLDRLNDWADHAITAEKEHILNPTWAWIKDQLIDLGHWIVTNLPDLMGYGAVLAGALIILGSMTGKGIMKPIAYYAGSFFVSVIILSSKG